MRYLTVCLAAAIMVGCGESDRTSLVNNYHELRKDAVWSDISACAQVAADMESVRTRGFRGITNYDDAKVTELGSSRYIALSYNIPTIENPEGQGREGFGSLNCEVIGGGGVKTAAIPNNISGHSFDEYYAEYRRRKAGGAR